MEFHLVNEIERHSSLSDPHLLGLPVFTVLGSNTVHTFLKTTSCFILLPILLSLQDKEHQQMIEDQVMK